MREREKEKERMNEWINNNKIQHQLKIYQQQQQNL